MTRRSFKGEAGFTLVEAMLAIGILAFSLSACVISFTMSMQAVKTGANQMAALHSARYELETLRTLSLTNSTALNAGTHSFTNGSVIGHVHGDQSQFVYEECVRERHVHELHQSRHHEQHRDEHVDDHADVDTASMKITGYQGTSIRRRFHARRNVRFDGHRHPGYRRHVQCVLAGPEDL